MKNFNLLFVGAAFIIQLSSLIVLAEPVRTDESQDDNLDISNFEPPSVFHRHRDSVDYRQKQKDKKLPPSIVTARKSVWENFFNRNINQITTFAKSLTPFDYLAGGADDPCPMGRGIQFFVGKFINQYNIDYYIEEMVDVLQSFSTNWRRIKGTNDEKMDMMEALQRVIAQAQRESRVVSTFYWTTFKLPRPDFPVRNDPRRNIMDLGLDLDGSIIEDESTELDADTGETIHYDAVVQYSETARNKLKDLFQKTLEELALSQKIYGLELKRSSNREVLRKLDRLFKVPQERNVLEDGKAVMVVDQLDMTAMVEKMETCTNKWRLQVRNSLQDLNKIGPIVEEEEEESKGIFGFRKFIRKIAGRRKNREQSPDQEDERT